MGYLDVEDVDRELAGEHRDLGEHAGTVGHRDTQLHQLGVDGGAHGQVAAGSPRPFEEVEQALPVAVGHQGAHGLETEEVVVETGDDGVAIGHADVGPDRRVPGSDAGHVAEAARGQAQQRGVLFAAPGGHVHERAGRELGHVAHDRDQRVVMFRTDRDDLRAEAGHEVTHECERIGIGGGRRGEDPGRAHEHLGVGTVEAVLLGPGHGVTAHEADGKGGLSRRARRRPPRPSPTRHR